MEIANRKMHVNTIKIGLSVLNLPNIECGVLSTFICKAKSIKENDIVVAPISAPPRVTNNVRILARFSSLDKYGSIKLSKLPNTQKLITIKKKPRAIIVICLETKLIV